MTAIRDKTAAPPRLHFSLAPESSHLLRARERIRDYLYEQGCTHEAIDAVVLVVEEAMTNAVRHSGVSDDLAVDLHFEGRDLVAEVRDHGGGFDVDRFDVTDAPDPLAAGGRGLFLIARLTDDLRLRCDGGLEVRAVKRRVLPAHRSPRDAGTGAAFWLPTDTAYSGARQQALLDRIDEMVVVLDWEYRYVFVNKAALAASGRPAEDFLGRPIWDVLPSVAASPQGAALREAMELGRFAVLEHASAASDDWVETRVYATAAGVAMFSRVINERKVAELEHDAAVREREERFRSLFANMTEGVVVHELVYQKGRAVDYRILEANPAFERQTGLVVDEARGRLASELYGSGKAPYLTEYARVAKSGRPHTFETHFAPMGRDFRIVAVALGLRRFATIFEDITERNRIERERRRLLDEAQARTEELAAQSEELRAQNEELAARARLAEATNTINRLAHSTLDIDEIMQGALDEAVRSLGVDGGTIELRVAAGWLVRYQRGFSGDDVGELLAPDCAPNAERAAATRELFTIADMRGAAADVGFVRSHSLRAVIAVPLIAHDEASGCLLLYGTEVRHFSRTELDFARRVGATVSLAIENARLFAAQRQAVEAEAKHAEQLETLHAVAGVSTASLGVNETAQRMLGVLAGRWGFSQAAVLLVDEERGELVPAAVHAPLPDGVADLPHLVLGGHYESVAALRTGETIVSGDVDAAPLSSESRRVVREAEALSGVPVKSWLIAPLRGYQSDLGTLGLSWSQSRSFSLDDIAFCESVAHEIAIGLENARLREAGDVELARTTFLKEVAAIAAGSLDERDIAARTLEAATMYSGAVAGLIVVVDHKASLLRSLAAVGPRELVERFRVTPLEEGYVMAEAVLRETIITHDTAEPSPEALRRAEGTGLTDMGLIHLPVRIGDEVAACLLLAFPSRRQFTEPDVEFFGAVAAQLGTAMQNARLYQAQRNIALTLQENFVHPLPQVAGLELAELALPAGREELIGGDFRDVIVRPDGLVVALVGDVTGKGMEAAGFTETVRAGVRTLALISPAPDYVLGNVNRLLLHEEAHQQLATALLVVLDPVTGHGSLASAGHPAPIHVSARSCRLLEPAYGLPLGVLERGYRATEFELAAGEALVMYTDGLTEARRDGELFGERRLLDVLHDAPGGEPHILVDRLHGAVDSFAGGLRDDLQILAIARRA